MATSAPSITIDTDNADLKDDFPGTTLNSSNWTVTQKSGTTTSYSVAGSILTINASTTLSDYIAFTSTQTYTLPFRAQFIVAASQRIINNNFYLELVNVAGTQTTALASLTVEPGVTQAAYVITGTTATSGNIVAQNQGVKATADTAATIVTTASYGVLEIEATVDSVSFGTRTTDIDAILGNGLTRNRTILDPGEQYYIQIRSLNGSTAPVSNTTLTVEAVLLQDATSTAVEIFGGRSNSNIDRGIPISVLPTLGTVTTVTGVTTVTTVTTVTGSGVLLPVESNPIASGAIVTTTTTVLAPTNGSAIILQLNVTAVSGTTPTMDVQVVESFDAGVTYTRVLYQFPRVTASIAQPLYSPPIQISGSKIEVIQTIAGTTPSFTRALFMDQLNRQVQQNILQIFDRTVTLTSLASTTGTLYSQNTGQNVQMDINVGAVTTTPPALQLQVSNDGGGSWFSIGSPLTSVASSTVSTTVTNTSAGLVRAIVTTAGSGVTAGYILLRTF